MAEPKVHWWNPYDDVLTRNGSRYGCGVKVRATGPEDTRNPERVTCSGCLRYLLTKRFPSKPKTEIAVRSMLFDSVLTDKAIVDRGEQIRKAVQEAVDEEFELRGAICLEDDEVHLVFARKLKI